ncbi:MAG TPA: PxKF domain-containing protein [Actinomycetes bacterium]|nr:PxKF domain-containing protein [Actinomycetes bacterium]
MAIFAVGLVTAGVVSGAGPLAVLSTDDPPATTETTTTTEASTESGTTETTSTVTTTTETTSTESTETTTEGTTTESTPVPAGPPTIASDKDDYLAGSTVTLSGKNWAPGEAIHIFVNDDAGQSWNYATDVSADGDGDFTLSFQLPNWFVALYRVTATGASGATASTTFTDLALSLYANTTDRNATSPAGPSDLVFKQGDTVYAKLNALNQNRYYRIQVLDNTSAQVALSSCVQGTTDPQTLDYTVAPNAAIATWHVRALRWNSSGCGGSPDATDATVDFFVVTFKTFSDASCTVAATSFSAAGTVYLKGTGWPFNRNNITVVWTRPNATTVSHPTGNDRPDTSGSGTWNACVGFGPAQNGSSLANGNWTVKATSANDEFTSAAFVVAATDTTPPSINCSVPNQTVWHADDVTVACTTTDSGSGLANPGTDASFSLSTAVATGSETMNAQTNSRQVCDSASPQNCATAGPYTFKVDKKTPSYSCGSADSAWHAANVSFACTANDGGSGLADSADSSFNLVTNVPANTEDASASTGSKVLEDAVGNQATAGPIAGNQVDRKAPQLSSCDTADAIWHAGNVTLQCHYTDGGSGPATQDVDLSTSVAPGVETNNAAASAGGAEACDEVANCAASPADITGNQVDRKAPTITCASPAPVFYLNQSPANVTGGAVDGGSGPPTQALSEAADTSSVLGNPKSVTFNASDAVGNAGAKQCAYSVVFNFHGFFSPVDIGLYNVVNSGQAIPVKFDLSGNQGLNIFLAGYPQSTKVACNTGTGMDDIEETVTAGNSSLTYNNGTPYGQYHYVWKTDKAWASTCRRLDLKFIDGTTRSAVFQFKK